MCWMHVRKTARKRHWLEFKNVYIREKAGREAAYTYSLFHSSHPCVNIFPTSIFFFFPPFFSISRYLYADPLHCNMTHLLLRLLKDDLKEYTYAARLAGLAYGLASGMNAILVSKPFEGTGWVCAKQRACVVCGNGMALWRFSTNLRLLLPSLQTLIWSLFLVLVFVEETPGGVRDANATMSVKLEIMIISGGKNSPLFCFSISVSVYLFL